MGVCFCCLFQSSVRAEGVNTAGECLSVVFTIVDEYQLFVIVTL